MSNSTTRIADLPENIKFETREIQQNMQPNHVAIPPPQDTQMRNQFIPTKEQQEMMIPTQPHTFPSRDIPMDQYKLERHARGVVFWNCHELCQDKRCTFCVPNIGRGSGKE